MSAGHTRYVGRDTNVQFFTAEGYKTFTAGLFLKNASAFRHSVVSVLQAGSFKVGADTTFAVSDKGFEVETMYIPGKQEFKFAFQESEATTDPHFMQVIGQFLVMTFIQMILDLERLEAKDVRGSALLDKEEVVKGSRAAVKMGLRFILNPQAPKQSKKKPSGMIAANAKQLLLEGITRVLNEVAGFNTATSSIRFDRPSMSIRIVIEPATDEVVVDFADVDTHDIFMIFNANIAATLLLAAKDARVGSVQLGRLPSVLAGFMSAIRGGLVKRPRASINLVISTR